MDKQAGHNNLLAEHTCIHRYFSSAVQLERLLIAENNIKNTKSWLHPVFIVTVSLELRFTCSYFMVLITSVSKHRISIHCSSIRLFMLFSDQYDTRLEAVRIYDVSRDRMLWFVIFKEDRTLHLLLSLSLSLPSYKLFVAWTRAAR